MAAYLRLAPRLAGPAMLSVLIALIGSYAIATGRTTIAVALVIVLLVLLPLLTWWRITRYDGLAIAVILTLAVPYWYTLGAAQASVFRIAGVFALVTAFLVRKARLRFTLADGAVAAIVVVTILGWLVQDDQSGVSRIVINVMMPLAFYVSARMLPTRQVGKIMTLASIAGVVGAVTVIYEFLVGHAVFLDQSGYLWNASEIALFRPGGIFSSPPGAITVLAMAILCGMPINRRLGKKWRSLHAVCLAVMLIASVLTFTRTGLIGLAVGLLAYIWLMRSSLLTPSRLLVAAIVLFVTLIIVLPQIENTKTFQQGIVRPHTLADRESFWRLALPIIKASTHNEIFGIGSERTLIPRTGGSMPAELATSPVLISHSLQNQYILTVLENGLIGLLALLAWIVATIGTGLRTVSKMRDPLSAALVGAFLIFVITLLTNNAFLHPPSLEMAALVSGLIVARGTAKYGTEEPVGESLGAIRSRLKHKPRG